MSVFELLTVLCADSAMSTEGLGDNMEVGADHKSVLEALKPIINLPRGVLENDCPVTLLSTTPKETVFVMVVPRTVLRFKLPTKMIVVVLQIL